ncbi:hypothetical protein ON010_g9033 [Phytophthora cinnamomi]|nr:hypothetical protein ON010_g9033 [Phytophthora cinnamomi]
MKLLRLRIATARLPRNRTRTADPRYTVMKLNTGDGSSSESRGRHDPVELNVAPELRAVRVEHQITCYELQRPDHGEVEGVPADPRRGFQHTVVVVAAVVAEAPTLESPAVSARLPVLEVVHEGDSLPLAARELPREAPQVGSFDLVVLVPSRAAVGGLAALVAAARRGRGLFVATGGRVPVVRERRSTDALPVEAQQCQ